MTTLRDISSYELKRIKQKKNKHNETFCALGKIKPEELNVGESAFIDNSKNKFKLINDRDFLFIRYDGIETHIDEYKSKYKLQDIKDKIISNLDTDIKYAKERSELVENLLSKNQWIFDLVSDHKMIKKEVKKKTSLLSENQKFDKLMEIMSTYIIHAKFEDQEDENKYTSLKEERNELANKKNKTELESNRLYELISIISNYDSKLSSTEKIDKITNFFDDLSERENYGDYAESTEEKKLEIKRKRYKNEHKFDICFWNKMGYSIEEKSWRNNIINNFEREIALLGDKLGKNIKDKLERSKHIEKLLSDFSKRKIYYEYNGKKYQLDAKRQLKILNDTYTNLKGDFKATIVKLTDQISFKRLEKNTTKYDWNFDTWYIDDNGNEVSISGNILSFSKPNTFKGLLLNHKDLKEKYHDHFNDDMWAILWDFEKMLNESDLTNEEQFVVDGLFNNKSQSEIRDDYYAYFGTELDKDRLSRMISTYIPNKLQSHYIRNVDDWLYTYKLYGMFKKCSKCEEVKLISNDRYFRKRSDSIDGFRNECRICELSAKNCEK